MTVITALRSGDRVWMASDSLCEDTGQAIRWDFPEKLAKINVTRRPRSGETHSGAEQVLIGTAGTAAIGAMVRHSMDWPDMPSSDAQMDRWAHQVGVAFYDMCKDRPFLIDSESGGVQGSFLLAWRDRLWEISAALAIPVEDYASIGSGALVANGVLFAMDEAGKLHMPAVCVDAAARAAVRHAAGCGGEIEVMST